MDNTSVNIYTKLNIRLHRIYGKIQSSMMSFGINKGYFISAGIAILSVVRVIYEANIDGWENVNYDINTLWPFLVTIVSTIYTISSSIINYRSYSHKFSIIHDNYYKNEVTNKIRLSERQVDNGYAIRFFYNGLNQEKYIISDDINVKLIEGEVININNLKYKFRLADEIKQYVPCVLKRSFMSEKVIFNGKLVRMASELCLDSDSVSVQDVRYFDGQCSNEIVYKKIKSNCSLGLPFSGECLLYDDANVLYDLGYSSCAKYIGASTLVITKDNYIVIGKQDLFSKSNAGRYAPSGSGSVNYKDLKSSKDFNSLIINAMEREFCEESHYCLDKKDKMTSVIIGYARLLERGGKPDFFGISFIDEYSYNLENEVKQLERGLAEKNFMLQIYDGMRIGQTLFGFCNRNIGKRKISIQLMIIAEILLKHEDKIVEMLKNK